MKRYKRFFEEASDSKFRGEDFYDRMASDPVAMGEIEMYIDNNGNLYRQQFLPIIKNIQRKIKSGKYDHALAPKLWGYLIEANFLVQFFFTYSKKLFYCFHDFSPLKKTYHTLVFLAIKK